MNHWLFIISWITYLSLVPKDKSSWLDGNWEGIGYQINTQTTWSIAFTADARKNSYRTEYPSLQCGGNWHLVKVTKQTIEFKEIITENQDNCINTGKVLISRIDENHISYSYFYPTDTQLNAFSTLKRKK